MRTNVMNIMNDLNKSAKEDLFHMGLSQYRHERIPFTSPRLNWMTFGGLPVGKLIEFYGENHGGKTTTALDIVANFQNMERQLAEQDPSYEPRLVLYADIENTIDLDWCKALNVDVDGMILFNPSGQGSETIFQYLLKMIDSGDIGLLVIDSLGAMMSNQAFEKSVEEKTYGGISMSLTNFSKKAEQACHKHGCTIIGINQFRADMNSPYGGKITTGGESWKYQVAVRLEFRMGKYFDEKYNDLSRGAENPMGNYVLVQMTKNKTCPPTRRIGFYTLTYLNGIDYLKDLVEVAMQEKVKAIVQSGAWYSIIDTDTGELIEKLQGVSKVYDYLSDPKNEEILKKIEDYIDKHINNRENRDIDEQRYEELAEDTQTNRRKRVE